MEGAPLADFSGYITLTNNLDVVLTRVAYGAHDGEWAKNPPEKIEPKKTTDEFQIKDKAGKRALRPPLAMPTI